MSGQSDVATRSNSVILRFAIAVALHVVPEHRHLEPHGGLFVKGLLDLHHYSRHNFETFHASRTGLTQARARESHGPAGLTRTPQSRACWSV
jgi:hypothetical protein